VEQCANVNGLIRVTNIIRLNYETLVALLSIFLSPFSFPVLSTNAPELLFATYTLAENYAVSFYDENVMNVQKCLV
jgi:hypothetical protein